MELSPGVVNKLFECEASGDGERCSILIAEREGWICFVECDLEKL